MSPISILQGFTIIMCIHFVSICLVDVFNLLLPAPLLGMIILTVLLLKGIVKFEKVQDAGYILLEYMGMLFIAPAISLVLYYDVLAAELVPIMVTLVISTLLVMVITGKIVQLLTKSK